MQKFYHLQVFHDEDVENRIRQIIPLMDNWLDGTLPLPKDIETGPEDPGVVFPMGEIHAPLSQIKGLIYSGVRENQRKIPAFLLTLFYSLQNSPLSERTRIRPPRGTSPTPFILYFEEWERLVMWKSHRESLSGLSVLSLSPLRSSSR